MMMKEYDLLLGSTMKQYRKKCKMTQDSVSKIVGCSKYTISRLENGNTHCDDSFIMKLCDIYGENYIETMKEIYSKMS